MHHLTRGRRNTPASAGRTGTQPGRPCVEAEHPHVGGEDGQSAVVVGWCGTPPRASGEHCRLRQHCMASAGTPLRRQGQPALGHLGGFVWISRSLIRVCR